MGATLQLIAAIPNAAMLEYCAQETVLSKNLMKNHFKLDITDTYRREGRNRLFF